MHGRGSLAAPKLDAIEPAEVKSHSAEAVGDVGGEMGKGRGITAAGGTTDKRSIKKLKSSFCDPGRLRGAPSDWFR